MDIYEQAHDSLVNHARSEYEQTHDKTKLQHAILKWNPSTKKNVFKDYHYRYMRSTLGEFETCVYRTLQGNLDRVDIDSVHKDFKVEFSKQKV